MTEEKIKEFRKLIYEPEHENGIVCWCKPKTFVKEGTPHIEHNEQRDVLTDFIESLLSSELNKQRAEIRQELLNASSKYIDRISGKPAIYFLEEVFNQKLNTAIDLLTKREKGE